jgi:hypothetical protein
MSIEVSIIDYDNNTHFKSTFNPNTSLGEIRNEFIKITPETKDMANKLYFFINEHICEMHRSISEFTSEYNKKSVYITAIFDYDNNFTNYNAFIWLSNESIGNYYMFCPKNMLMEDIKKKYLDYINKKKPLNIDSKNIRFISVGKLASNEDKLENFCRYSYYAVFKTYFPLNNNGINL